MSRQISLIGLLLAALLVSDATARPPTDRLGYVTGRYTLEIDGVGTAQVTRVSGGYHTADVVEQRSGGDAVARKQPGNMRVEPLTVEISPGELIDLLKDTCDMKLKKYTGRLIETDPTGKVVSEKAFTDAIVTEVGFPTLDATAKEPARISLTIRPQQISSSSGSKGSAGGGGAAKQKAALASNFRLTIPNTDCSKVSKIDSIQITQKSPTESGVDRRAGSSKSDSGTSFGNLVITLTEGSGKSFVDWHEDFIVKGKSGQENERTATIELLSPDLKQTIMTLEASGVGILSVRPVPSQAGADKARLIEVEMYVEQWRVK